MPVRSLLSALCALALAATAAAPAAARAPSAAGADLALEPVSGSAYPRFAARPGARFATLLRVRNLAGRARVVRLTPADLGTADTGGITFVARRPGRPGRWLELDRRDVTLRPHESRTVRLTAAVAGGAEPGEHYAGVVAVDRADLRRARAAASRDGDGVRLARVTRLALPVRFALPGPAPRRLATGRVAVAVDALGPRIDVGIANPGRRLVRRTDVDLRVVSADDRRELFRQRGRIADIVPGTSLRYPIAWRGRAAEGEYRVVGVLRPHGAPAVRVDAPVAFTRARSRELELRTGERAIPRPASPLPLLAVLAVAAAGATIAVHVASGGRRRRRRLS